MLEFLQIDYLSLLIPISYLSILIASMGTFSYLYRRRQHQAKLRLAPYFPPHTTRNIYLSLLHLPDTSDAKVPDSVLRAALLSRAMTDIHRIMEVRTRKPALATLLQRGVVGDEIFQRVVRAEQELEAELKDVVAEANGLAPEWGKTIFQSAGEMVQNQLLKEKLERIKGTIPEEKRVWEETRERARRELEGGSAPANVPVSTAGAGEAALAATTTTPVAKPVAAGSSDEDAVLVDANAADDEGASGGSKKKKKNKK
jgi:translocation protein SEC66